MEYVVVIRSFSENGRTLLVCQSCSSRAIKDTIKSVTRPNKAADY